MLAAQLLTLLLVQVALRQRWVQPQPWVVAKWEGLLQIPRPIWRYRSNEVRLMKDRRSKSGFTLVELIVIIVIVGIVALIAAPRFFTRSTFDAARFHEAAISAIRYAQKVAQAQHTDVYVVPSANTVSLCYTNATCTTPVKAPGDNSAAFVVIAPTGVGLTGSGFNFNSLGQPNPNAMQTLTVTGDTVVRQIVVEHETGYVHK